MMLKNHMKIFLFNKNVNLHSLNTNRSDMMAKKSITISKH